MENEILFTEKQRFKQWWLWVILIGVNALFIYGFFKQIVGGEQFGENPMSNTGLIISTALTILLTLLFITFGLDTIIKKDGIYVRFFPFHLKFKYYSWDILKKSYIRKYSAITEYGGWGLRYGLLGKGTAFNVSGNKGLQLEFINNTKLLIGTQKPEKLTEILSTIGKIKL